MIDWPAGFGNLPRASDHGCSSPLLVLSTVRRVPALSIERLADCLFHEEETAARGVGSAAQPSLEPEKLPIATLPTTADFDRKKFSDSISVSKRTIPQEGSRYIMTLFLLYFSTRQTTTPADPLINFISRPRNWASIEAEPGLPAQHFCNTEHGSVSKDEGLNP